MVKEENNRTKKDTTKAAAMKDITEIGHRRAGYMEALQRRAGYMEALQRRAEHR